MAKLVLMASLARVDRLSMTGVSSISLVYTYIYKLLGVNNQKVSGVPPPADRWLRSGQFEQKETLKKRISNNECRMSK
jgi:hypothetical protein